MVTVPSHRRNGCFISNSLALFIDYSEYRYHQFYHKKGMPPTSRPSGWYTGYAILPFCKHLWPSVAWYLDT